MVSIEEKTTGPSAELDPTLKEPLVCPAGVDVGAEATRLEESGPEAPMLVLMASFPPSPKGDQSKRESTPSLT
ncbi:hypothetical protein Nepgr_004663 [Nepenthes gracilis]|uniref:Uncharacterized protein n=1 Tax=Nepenthes gracilis TaxID=150966 RepID=A0AAD3S1W1_NEPGR|nr:hypothetical protein Nepgr_004663 [Nepenthes gracilis]